MSVMGGEVCRCLCFRWYSREGVIVPQCLMLWLNCDEWLAGVCVHAWTPTVYSLFIFQQAVRDRVQQRCWCVQLRSIFKADEKDGEEEIMCKRGKKRDGSREEEEEKELGRVHIDCYD